MPRGTALCASFDNLVTIWRLRYPPQSAKFDMEAKPSGQGEDLRLEVARAFPIPDRRYSPRGAEER